MIYHKMLEQIWVSVFRNIMSAIRCLHFCITQAQNFLGTFWLCKVVSVPSSA